MSLLLLLLMLGVGIFVVVVAVWGELGFFLILLFYLFCSFGGELLYLFEVSGDFLFYLFCLVFVVDVVFLSH